MHEMTKITGLAGYGTVCLAIFFLVGMSGQQIPDVFAADPKLGNGYIPQTNPYALHIAVTVAVTSAVLSKIYFRKPELRTSSTLPHGTNTDEQAHPGKYDRQAILYYWVRPITYNITVLAAYLAGMSVIVGPGLELLVGVMRFDISIIDIPAYMAGPLHQMFLEDGYLSQTAQHITHPNLYLFYAIFILPFMVGATKILHGDAELTKRMWFKKIIIYILKISILLIIMAVIFIFLHLPTKPFRFF